MTVALMWEARAADGRGDELLAWVRRQTPGDGREPLRRETFRAPGDRVLVITWWDTESGIGAGVGSGFPELPDPEPDLVSRPVHRWRFESVGEG
ncbi:hypothetical protein [Streptomyces sp. NPDC047000]|uniref:hypothetical protein n=1 Tax=Streptomyces sp. NPDC047000 TaxID=3155474 RepID=UPI003407AEE2